MPGILGRVTRKIFLYFLLPLIIVAPMMGMYFSGVEILRDIITPAMPNLHENSEREFGLLENVQNVILLGILGVAIFAYRKKCSLLDRAAMVGIIAVTLFVFLEEIDYGLHYYEYLIGIERHEAVEVRNWHNEGDRARWLKVGSDVVMAVLFVIAPIFFVHSRYRVLRHFTPDRYSILTVVLALVVRTVAHELQRRGYSEGGRIERNISEFREVITYYLFLMYVITIGLQRHLHEPEDGTG